jgi:hypothetical protein
VKKSGAGEGGRRKHHFREMRQLSAMSADDSDSCAAQLLGNGGKIEPYTIIIMPGPSFQIREPTETVMFCFGIPEN